MPKPWVLSADRYDMELVSVIASLVADAAWAALGDYNEEPDACSLLFLFHEGGATTMVLSTQAAGFLLDGKTTGPRLPGF